MPTTTIKIDLEVREELLALGRMGESYNDVIRRLLAAHRRSDLSHGQGRTSPESGATLPWIPLRERR